MCYAASFVNCVFTVMAFRLAVVFGVLYASVALMFLVVGLNFSQKLDDSVNDPSDTSGGRIAGIFCLNVSLQCFYLLIPVMTGKLGVVFTIPNPFAAAPADPPPAEDGVIEPQTKIKLVDANGLALTCFGFSTFMFFVFKCNVDGTNWGNHDDPADPKTNHAAVHMLTGMLTWGTGMGLLVAGIFQFLNGDHLGFTSYIFHAAILGTTGYWIDDLLVGFGSSTYIYSYFYYCAFFFNVIFTIMAFKIAKMFGVLYATVALMFLVVGLDWSHVIDNSEKDPKDHTGSMIGGIVCLAVALQCFYLFVPVMTGRGILM
jgi:drug/metabolite transporter superfamily protein YnfA